MDTIPDDGLPAETVQMLNDFLGWAWWFALLVLIGSGIAVGGAFAWQRSQAIADAEAPAHLLRIAVIACAVSAPATLVLHTLR